MDSVTRYEIMARAFYIETGLMAPGKDAPPELYQNIDDRFDAWEKWTRQNESIIKAMFLAFEDITTEDNEG